MVNTTPINILDNNKNWKINPQTIAFDAVYTPKEGTGFLKNFQPKNRVAGIDMLIYQALASIDIWFRKNISKSVDLSDLKLYLKEVIDA